MGKKRKSKKGLEKKSRDAWDKPGKKPLTYAETPRENEKFFSYYKEQKIVSDEEWETFCEKLRETLPSCFRITSSGSEGAVLLKLVESQCFQDLFQLSLADDVDGAGAAPAEKILAPRPLPWYPGNMAWTLSLPRRVIRRHETLNRLHRFLIDETASGNISRQEAVSMIPPLLLDVQPHHRVLDLCAAPGSKTGQIIEMLECGQGGGAPSGFVVANDVDNKRCYMLVHQAKRLQSARVLVTNHDARTLPNLRLMNAGTGSLENVSYDRILCDVPCTGDGTLRKNIDCWAKWHPNTGRHMHFLQTKILRRALELLACGGRLVYSTCSFNPLENEAVIASMLGECRGAIQLAEVAPEELAGLRRRPGLTTWKVLGQTMQRWYERYEDVGTQQGKQRITPSMFPPPEAVASNLHLERCWRLLPHDQDTGGFFVAVLHKHQPLPWTAKLAVIPPETNLDTQSSSAISVPPRKKQRFHGFKEEPFVFFEPNESVYPAIKEFYGVADDFDPTRLMTRCVEGRKRTIYLVSKELRDIVKENSDRVKMINTGVRVMARSDKKGVACEFRLAQDGLQSWLPHISKRKVEVTSGDVITLMTCENPYLTRFNDETRKMLVELGTGSIVFMFDGRRDRMKAEEGKDSGDSDGIVEDCKKPDTESEEMQQRQALPDVTFSFCGWNGITSARCFVPKTERMHFLRLLGVDTAKYEEDDKVKKEEKSNEEETEKSNEEETGGTGNSHSDEQELGDASMETDSLSKECTDKDG